MTDISETLFAILDWCGEHDALLIAVIGFWSSVTIARINNGLDIKKALCLRRFQSYESAITHLSSKLSVYLKLQDVFESLKELTSEVGIIKNKIVILDSLFRILGESDKEDFKILGVALYTEFPPYDRKPLLKEIAYFYSRYQEFLYLADLPVAEEQLNQFLPEFRVDIERIVPLIEREANYLNEICDQLKKEIVKDKTIKKFFRKSSFISMS